MELKEKFQFNEVEDYTSSLTLIKQLTIVSISTIMYLKDALPRDCYREFPFEDIMLHVIKKTCTNDLAQFLSTSLIDAFDALDKKYLHKLALCFKEGEGNFESLVESHVFEYTYKHGRVSMSLETKNWDNDKCTMQRHTFVNIRGQALGLIKNYIVLMDASRKQLCPTFGLSLRLYYLEGTPDDYHAPGFTSSEDLDDHADMSLEVFKVRSVETLFHKLCLRSYFKTQAIKASQEAIPSQNPPVLSIETGDLGEEGAYGRLRMLCPCNKYGNEHNADLLTCFYCGRQQHAVCFGILRSDVDTVVRHCCALCHDADPTRGPTDHKLVSLGARKRACLCIFRRALEYLLQLETLNVGTLAKHFRMSNENAYKLMKMFYQYGIIPLDPTNHVNEPQKISEEHLQLAMVKFFNTKKENVVAEIEMLASQESRASDPIADMLKPHEKFDIQSTSSLGRVIERPSEPIVEDPTLKLYREALISEEIKDPLPVEMKPPRKRRTPAANTTSKRVLRKR